MCGRGFTLVESMVAAVLLTVGILTVLGAERNARRLGESGGRRLRAVEAAASSLEVARSRCATGVPLAEGPLAVTVAAGPGERAVRVEARLACGTPP